MLLFWFIENILGPLVIGIELSNKGFRDILYYLWQFTGLCDRSNNKA